MKSVKKIIWIVWDFWFSEKNKKIFQDLDILTLQIKWEEDLEKCDWLFFWTSSFFQLKNFYSKNFFEKILEKIENNFPILCVWQASDFFLEKIWNWKILEKTWKILEKTWKILDYEWEIFLDFLDSKEMKIKIYKNFYFTEKKIWFLEKIFFWYKNFFKSFWKISSWEKTVFIYKNSIFTIFSTEFFLDKRIYEYFINKYF